MQEETQNPGAAAKPGGSEGLGQEQPSGEGPAAAPSDQGGSPFLGVNQTGPPPGDVDEIEMSPDYVGTPPPDPVEQAGADAEDVEIEMPPDPVGQVGAPGAAALADGAVGGAAVGAVGEAGGPGETIEEAGEAILDPPEAAEDAFISKEQWDYIRQHIPPGTPSGAPSEPAPSKIGDAVGGDMTHPDVKAAESAANAAADAVKDKGEAVEESVEITGEALEDVAESIPIVGDDLGDAIGDATDTAQDVVDDVDVFWSGGRAVLLE